MTEPISNKDREKKILRLDRSRTDRAFKQEERACGTMKSGV